MKHIGDHPTPEMYQSGLELDVCCARCGSIAITEACDECEGGWIDEEDGPGHTCQACDGRGVYHVCLSSPEWCEANPAPGREGVQRGTLEWFTY